MALVGKGGGVDGESEEDEDGEVLSWAEAGEVGHEDVLEGASVGCMGTVVGLGGVGCSGD